MRVGQAMSDDCTQCMTLLEQGCMGPGVLKIAVTNTSIGVRWSMPKSLTKLPSQQGIGFALNLAPATREYCQLTDAESKYKWVTQKALAADQWNRNFDMSGLLDGALSAFHGLGTVCTSDAPAAHDKPYPSLSKAGRASMHMPGDPGAPEFNVLTLDAFGSKFSGKGTTSLKMEKPLLRALMSEIDKKNGALFLKDTCWKIELYDERTKPDPEPKREQADAPEPKRQRSQSDHLNEGQ